MPARNQNSLIFIDDIDEKLTVSYKEVLKNLKKYWRLFIGFTFIGIVISIIIYLTTTPKYESRAMLLLNVEDDGSSAFKSLQELVSSYNPRLMYENEVVILKSNKLCLRTIESFDYEVSYFEPSIFTNKEITLNSPIEVIIDKNKPQLIYTEFVLHDIDITKNIFRLKVTNPKDIIFDYKTKKTIRTSRVNEIIDSHNSSLKYFHFGEWIETDLFKFKINIRGQYSSPERLIFRLNNPFIEANELSRNLKFSPTAKESSGVDIFFHSNTKEKTEFLLRKHIEEYQRLGREIKNENLIKTLDFINFQLSQLQDSLRDLETRIQLMKSSNLLLDSKGQGITLLQKLFELDKKDFELKLKEQVLNTLIHSSENSDLNTIILPQIYGFNDPSLNSLVNKFNLLKIQRQKLYYLSDENPLIIQINNELKSILNLIQNYGKNMIKKNSEEIKVNKQKIREVESELSEIPGLELNLLSIERNYKILENIYIFFLYKKSEIEISMNFTKSNILFIDYLNTDPIKISPILSYNLLIGGFGSFGLIVLIVLIITISKNTIDELTNFEIFTNLNILSLIPHNRNSEQNIVFTQPQSIIAESFRIIRSNLKFYKNPEEKCITTLITSFVPGEGKSFCSLNLATILALSGKKVLLIGADMRKPKLYEDLKAKNEIGLSTYLSGHTSLEESVQITTVENLYLISAGPIPPNPSELIITKKFELLMEHSKNVYDYIVIDTPPLLAVNDASEIMNYSDLNIIVVRKNVTQLSFLRNLESKIQKNSIRNAAIVLNDFDSSPVGVGISSQLKGYGYIVE
ncbi:MAG: polysaccharide biosynthesis tyrosine autokinase [Thermaurantimonas sp.]